MPLNFSFEVCSGCKICQLVCALNTFKESNPAKSFLNVYGKFPAPGKYYADYCDQCGFCASICPSEAIREENGVYLVDEDRCICCTACVEECPKKVMRMVGDVPHKCVDCGECAALCPRDALQYSKGEVLS